MYELYPDLPIKPLLRDIVDMTWANRASLVHGAGGTGKSTLIGKAFVDMGHHVEHAVPRRRLAESIPEYVAALFGLTLGNEVGYAHALRQLVCPETKLIYNTNGHLLNRVLYDQMLGRGQKKDEVWLLDEIHEESIETAILLALAKERLKTDSSFHLVCSSATMKISDYKKYLHTSFVEVPGQNYPIRDLPRGASPVRDAAYYLGRRKNVLVILPGKREIERALNDLYDAFGEDVVLLPFHGDLSLADQAACSLQYDRPVCILATNAAGTGITLDIDVVIIDGRVRRSVMENGVEWLRLEDITYYEYLQYRARVGRWKPGICIYHGRTPVKELKESPPSEIERGDLASWILRLKAVGRELHELDLIHHPSAENYKYALKTLKALGCIDGRGVITQIGLDTAAIPAPYRFARMVVEGRELGVEADLLKVASILVADRLTDGTGDGWRKFCEEETDSDLLAQLEVYKAVAGMTDADLKAHGISPASYHRAHEWEGVMVGRQRMAGNTSIESSGNRHDIIQAFRAGLPDREYWKKLVAPEGSKKKRERYLNGDGKHRVLTADTVLGTLPPRLVGLPRDIDVPVRGRDEPSTKHFVTYATRI